MLENHAILAQGIAEFVVLTPVVITVKAEGLLMEKHAPAAPLIAGRVRMNMEGGIQEGWIFITQGEPKRVILMDYVPQMIGVTLILIQHIVVLTGIRVRV
jgi:hypothetical protein